MGSFSILVLFMYAASLGFSLLVILSAIWRIKKSVRLFFYCVKTDIVEDKYLKIIGEEMMAKDKMKALIINCSPVCSGATAEIATLVSEQLSNRYNVKSICIDDYTFAFCKGCRSCHNTAKCVMSDATVIEDIMDEFDAADIIVSVSPSYWADIPGQFKAFIDRCTPWCNTHEPHATIRSGKRGYSIALRTGPSMPECERIIQSIEHFYGHLEIQRVKSLGLCSVEYKEDVEPRKKEIIDFCEDI